MIEAHSTPVILARGADVPEIPGDLSLKTCGSTASMKVKHVKKSTTPGLMGCDNIHRLPFTKGHFPKMAECAHFHYENVEFGSIQLSLSEEQNEVMKNGCESKELVYLVQIACQPYQYACLKMLDSTFITTVGVSFRIAVGDNFLSASSYQVVVILGV
ncbi:PREDICTED: rho GTPase-activating protein 32-like [Galeopterus variegatus]|uniref:Rho GTPase-activating protein 32-like n=1 Tax=Galeopterus variegatus TaxID=482537 RepID=A0ABM0Q8N3_GALVR|nr:PREDICTED: rho GTPase-activating protein 32-like [Galeopterus variegatus]